MLQIRPLRISKRDCFVLIMLVIMNTINVTNMANNIEKDSLVKDKSQKEEVNKLPPLAEENEEYLKHCPITDDSTECSTLNYPCIKCDGKPDCIYGKSKVYNCSVLPKVQCNGVRQFNRTAMCRFCYQTEKWEHRCVQRANCNSLASPMKYYATNCTVSDNIICLGQRQFPKRIRCTWTGGTRWGTALILALTLGGFGADRFYLGHWQEGIGKLFSFGGLGVWTLIDALLIGIHHLGPADGSVYI